MYRSAKAPHAQRRSRRVAWIAALALMTGCVSRPKLTEDHAAGCVRQTFAFLELKRGIAASEVRTITHTENDPVNGKDEIFVHAIHDDPTGAVGRRLGTFRVQQNRRIDVWDAEKENWRTVGSCD